MKFINKSIFAVLAVAGLSLANISCSPVGAGATTGAGIGAVVAGDGNRLEGAALGGLIGGGVGAISQNRHEKRMQRQYGPYGGQPGYYR